MGDFILLFIFSVLVGGILLWTSFTGLSDVPVFTGILGIYFIFLPIAPAMGLNKVFLLMVALLLGLLWTTMALFSVTKPFRYCIKKEVTYLQPIYAHKGRNSSRKFYALQCRVPVGRHIRQLKSEDWYKLPHIEKRYTPNTTLTVWVHKKHENKFLVRRCFGVGANLCLLLPGIGFLEIGIKLLIDVVG